MRHHVMVIIHREGNMNTQANSWINLNDKHYAPIRFNGADPLRNMLKAEEIAERCVANTLEVNKARATQVLRNKLVDVLF